ncbi:MAG TPA: CaiB/BaiF CoA-transferase family protein [Terriglobales bacterium]|nr:CaiB/BaiF CoA-transferase family protein [Terriglobales bacterium]
MTSLLDSIRVVELTEALAGPYCAMLLGDLGADVIKVERRQVGDQSRGWGPPFVGDQSAYFLASNRNKRSLTLDFDQPRGQEILRRLLASADVFLINNPSLESLRRRGLDPETLCAQYPRLICCCISGYGLVSPKAGLPGYDIIAQAEAGLMSFTGEPDGEPMRYPVAIADMTCGIYSALGITAALYGREKSGRGQYLDMALFDSQLTWLINIGSNFLNAQQLPERWGNAHPSIVPYQVFRGSDKRYFVVGVGTEPLWKRFTQLLGVEESLGRDPRFVSNQLRIANRNNLIPIVQAIFETATSCEWVKRLAAAEIPAAAIQTVPEALSDVQTIARGLIVELEHPILGAMRSIANPIRLSSTPVSYRLPPPFLGEHTTEVLTALAYSLDEIEKARIEFAI